ncbi:DUF2334 domain-containing protein [Gracilibacillus xinjiangensis]|uniref:DUF2334 domain-containing protein n=1 Tax=Gracilibacillus xinjiangensis TaxID=1193282 RepID=A0ABV8X0T8_9BACI
MKKVIIFLFYCMIYAIISSPILTHAIPANKIKVLIVYSSSTQEITEHERLLDMLISHFSNQLSFRHTSELNSSDIETATHLIYYGNKEEKISNETIRLMDDFEKPFLAIGHNIEQFPASFSWIEGNDTTYLNNVTISTNEQSKLEIKHLELIPISTSGEQDIFFQVTQKDSIFPLMVQKGDHYYLSTTQLFPPVSNLLADALHIFFDQEHEHTTRAMLRLEDVHPKLSAKDMMKVAEYLKEKDIPYIISIIPVYINSETDEEYHFSDNPELAEVLQFMQENGGSFVLHGYTDQFGNGTTGEGFEFWNKEKNEPVYFPENSTEKTKTLNDFKNTSDYEAYINERQAFESEYIISRMEKGIKELANYRIYPVAFEAPHYAMSQNGYRVVSEYFSTYIGQVQLTDKDWRIMAEAPTISQPSFLHGMTLIPETIRYIRYEDPQSITQMSELIDEVSIVRDGIISGFYHPFLGIGQLKGLVNEIEKIPDMEWMDISKLNNTDQDNNTDTSNQPTSSFITEPPWFQLSIYPLQLYKSGIFLSVIGVIIVMFLIISAYRKGLKNEK